MTEHSDSGRAQGDPGEANRGIGQERVDEPSPAPRQRAMLAPAAGGPGAGSGPTRSSEADGAPATEEDRAVRDQGRPQNA